MIFTVGHICPTYVYSRNFNLEIRPILNQNDYIMRQIYQLTQVLERVIAVVVGLKVKRQSQEAIQVVDRALNEHLEFDLDSLLEMNADDMIRELKDKPGINDENLEYIADIFYELGKSKIGDDNSDVKPKIFFERALKVYRHIESVGTIYSIDRNHKIGEIEKRLFGK